MSREVRVANIIVWSLVGLLFLVFLLILFLRRSGTAGTSGSTCSVDANCSGNGLCRDGACQCSDGWSGVFCDIVHSDVNNKYYKADCNVHPVVCTQDADCGVCDNVTTCQYTKKNENYLNLEGYYCMSAEKQITKCESNCGGNWEWSGWSGVEAMAWRCNADYPGIFPSGNCTDKAANICPQYEYPMDGSLPELNLKCTCDTDTCQASTDCKDGAPCVGNICKRKVGWNASKTGPLCVPDTCQTGSWVAAPASASNPYGIHGACPGLPLACSGHGICTPPTCQCFEGYVSSDCGDTCTLQTEEGDGCDLNNRDIKCGAGWEPSMDNTCTDTPANGRCCKNPKKCYRDKPGADYGTCHDPTTKAR